jgi:hypothetical protein
MEDIFLKFTKSIEEYLNKIICSSFDLPTNSLKINCKMIAHDKVTVNRMFTINFDSYDPEVGTIDILDLSFLMVGNQILMNDEKEIFLKFFMLKKPSFKTSILLYYDNYIKEFLFFVEENIKLIASKYIEQSNDNQLYQSSNISSNEKFKLPPFKIKYHNKGEVSHVYKRGEGYCQFESGITSYEFIKINKSLCIKEETEIRQFLETKKGAYRYSDNYYGFDSTKSNDKEYHYENIDIDLTRFLLNYDVSYAKNQDFENFIKQKHKKMNETINKKYLYFVLFILYCDLKEYFNVIKNSESKKGKGLRNYYFYLFEISTTLKYINYNSIGSECLSENFFNELPQFDYIINTVSSKFKLIPIENYLDNFLINLDNKVTYDLNELVFILNNFFKEKLHD